MFHALNSIYLVLKEDLEGELLSLLALAEINGAKQALAALYNNMKDEMSESLRAFILSLLSELDDVMESLEKELSLIHQMMGFASSVLLQEAKKQTKKKASPKAVKSNS